MTNVNTSFSNMNAMLASLPISDRNVQDATPTNGSTVTIADDNNDRLLRLNHASLIAAVNIQFPSDANSQIGQKIYIWSKSAVTTVTYPGVTIQNIVSTFAPGDMYVFKKTGVNTWSKQL